VKPKPSAAAFLCTGEHNQSGASHETVQQHLALKPHQAKSLIRGDDYVDYSIC
jgi:hypothetical protein